MTKRPIPCPFAHPVIDGLDVVGSAGHYQVHCLDCEATGPTKDTRAEAIEAWNTRVTREGDGDGQH